MALAPILLLHGQPGSGHDWAGVRAELGSDAITIAIADGVVARH